MDDRIDELMSEGYTREEAREIARREEAEAAYQTSQAPAPRRLTRGDWTPTSSPAFGPPPASESRPSRPAAADGPCRCGGAGFYVADVPYGDPEFGRLVPCSCTVAARSRRAAGVATSILAQLHRELGRLRHCTIASFDLGRDLRPLEYDGVVWSVEAQRASLAEGLAAAEVYADDPAGWLYIYGPVGSGKSHLAAAVASHLAAQGRTTAYATAAGLITFLKAGFRDGSADQRLLALQEVELLVIDDMGTQRALTVGEWAFEQFFELINTRYRMERPTILTSNLPPDHLEERLQDRVTGMAIEIRIVAYSYRSLNRRQAQ